MIRLLPVKQGCKPLSSVSERKRSMSLPIGRNKDRPCGICSWLSIAKRIDVNP